MANGGNSFGAGSPEGKLSDDAIRAQLKRTMLSRFFAPPAKCSASFFFVFQQKHAGRSQEICAESIGQRLYLKARGHDLDAYVRAAAGHLRNTRDCYHKDPGLADEIRVSIPASTYAPGFKYQEEPPLTLMPRARDTLHSNI
jgi:hypothetical protein